jgi:hypothetical protein
MGLKGGCESLIPIGREVPNKAVLELTYKRLALIAVFLGLAT